MSVSDVRLRNCSELLVQVSSWELGSTLVYILASCCLRRNSVFERYEICIHPGDVL